MNRIDKLIAGLQILRPKAQEICFYNSSCTSMWVKTTTPIDPDEAETLEAFDWRVEEGTYAYFDEGLVEP